MTVSLNEAQSHLAELIHSLPMREELIITEGDCAIARLRRESTPVVGRREPGLAKGMLIILEDDDEHLKDFAEYMP